MATATKKKKKMITLYSSDGEEFMIEESVAKKGRTNSKRHVDSSSKVITYPKRTFTLCSSDGEEFVVEESEAVESETIKQMFEDGCAGQVIPLPDVKGEVLSKVIEYLEKHVYEKTTDEELRAWDAEFVNVDSDMLFELIVVADDLGIDSLGHLALDRLKASCNIKNCFTSEKEEVRRKGRKR